MLKIIRTLVRYILVIVVILQCHSLLSHVYSNKHFLYAISGLLVILFFLEIKFKINWNVLQIAISYLVVTMLLFTVGNFKDIEFLFSIVTAFLLFFFYLSNKDNLIHTLECYTNVLIAISALSLFFFVFGSSMKVIKPTAYYPYSVVEWGTQDYYDFYHLYCEGQIINMLGYSGVRNTALFVEGPMLTYPLAFALYYELFLRKPDFRKWVLVIYVATMITSFSTTGFLILGIVFYIKFYGIIKKSKVIKFLIIPLLAIVVIYALFYIMQDKLENGAVSAGLRSDDTAAALKCFLHNPLIGVGYENIRGIDPYRLLLRKNPGLSTGLGAILAYGGILWGTWYIIPYVIAIKKYIMDPSSRNKMGFIILAAVLLAVTVVQTRILCSMINAICWLFILDIGYFQAIPKKKIKLKFSGK